MIDLSLLCQHNLKKIGHKFVENNDGIIFMMFTKGNFRELNWLNLMKHQADKHESSNAASQELKIIFELYHTKGVNASVS